MIVRFFHWFATASIPFASILNGESSDNLPRTPPRNIDEAIASFALKPGFKIEPVATEPLIADPVAIAFAPDGSLFVAEMRGYSERRDEAMGRVSRLVDLNGDGRYETATIFIDNLKWPTGLICWNDGIFVAATPDLHFYRDTNGDGVADRKKLVFTGFGKSVRELNVQGLVNSLTWGPDGRIYGSTARNGGEILCPSGPNRDLVSLRNSDFSFDPSTFDLRREPGTAQHGLTFDEFGQRYVCSNSRHLIAVMYGWPWNETSGLPGALIDIPVDGPAAEVFRTSTVEPWRVLRTRWRVQGRVGGPVEGEGRAAGYFTSASGLTVYGGDAFPQAYRGNIFVGDVGSNLVHRKIIERTPDRVQPRARRATDEVDREFLTSTDNWFRPVQCTNGPDGALYVVDMYREVIEHPKSLPAGIKEHLDLNSGNDRGRIWRIVPEGFPRPPPRNLAIMPSNELRMLLRTGNHWIQDSAHMVLLARGEAVDRVTMKRSPAWTRFETALKQLENPDASVLLQLLEKGEGDPWLGKVVAEAARRGEIIGDVFGRYENVTGASQWLRSIRFTNPSAGDAQKLRPLFDRAIASPDQADAVWLMGIDPTTTPAQLWAIVEETNPDSALGALDALRRRHEEWPKGVLQRWEQLPAAVRKEALEILPGAELAEALESGLIDPREIGFSRKHALRRIDSKVLRERFLKLLGNESPLSRKEALAEYRPAAGIPGEAGAGAIVFGERCAACHVGNTAGVLSGPPLDSFRQMGIPMLLENIIDPNREIAPQYFTWEATLDDGTVRSGMLVKESPDEIVLRQAGGIDIPISRKKLSRLVNANLSLMPSGLEAGLSLQQMADLLAYLAGKQ